MPMHSSIRAGRLAVAAAAFCIWAAVAPASGGPPRVVAHSGAYELVAVVDGGGLTLYLDRFVTNEPVTDAAIEIIAGAERVAAEVRPDGSYRASLPSLARHGWHELVFSIVHASGDDLLAAVLDRGQPGAAAPASPLVSAAGARSWNVPGLVLALVAGLIIGLALRRLPPRRPT